MLFLFVLLLSFSTDSDSFVFRNSNLLASRIAATTRHCRKRPTTAEISLLSTRGEHDPYESGNVNENENEKDRLEGDENERENENDAAELFLLEYSIDSFLRGDYDRTFAEDAASPLPGLSPSGTVDAALRSLRDLDEPEPSHGAAVFLRFCVELGRGERWGTTRQGHRKNSSSSSLNSWTDLLRGALTPTMLARRIRASEEFSSLLDWTFLEVAEDAYGDAGTNGDEVTVFRNVNVACVDAALSFDDESNERNASSSPPEIYRFELAKMLGGVWLIKSVQQRASSGIFRQPQNKRSKKAIPTRSTRKSRKSEEGRKLRRSQQQGDKPRRQQVDEDEDKTDEMTTK